MIPKLDLHHLSMETTALLERYRTARDHAIELELPVSPLHWFVYANAGGVLCTCINGAHLVQHYGLADAPNLGDNANRVAEILHVSVAFVNGSIAAFDGHPPTWNVLDLEWYEGYKVGCILRYEWEHGRPFGPESETKYD